jgi:hypothetical protein
MAQQHGWFYSLSSGKNSLGLCALLYNPALPYLMSNKYYLLPYLKKTVAFMRFVLGGQDDVIKTDNLNFLAQNGNPQTDYDITIKGGVHQIPIDIFERNKRKPF